MAYNNAIPNGPDWISASQPQIKDNFTALDTIFGLNHITYSAGSDNGEHTKVTFNNVTADPALGTLVYPKSLLYTKHTGVNPDRTSQLYFSNENENLGTKTISHVSGILAWAKVQVAPVSVLNGFNITSMVVAGVGYKFTFTTPLPNANYVINYSLHGASGGYIDTQLAASFTLRLPSAPTYIYVSVIGQ